MNDIKSHVETIQCPECKTIQDALVLHTMPLATYIHDCVKCEYTIMESEWDLVLPPLPPNHQSNSSE
jgi:Zn ribbon nucleic-acid-binding protein